MTIYTKADPIEVRLWSRVVEQPNGCRVWTGSTQVKGYGKITFNGKTTTTHRVAWILTNGPIPEGMHVCHRCDNPPCCNVEKCLFLGTAADNQADKAAKGRSRNQNAMKTHCPGRHEYTEANTYVNPKGSRECRICKNATRLRYVREVVA